MKTITRRRLMGAALSIAGALVVATFTEPGAAAAAVAGLPALDVKAKTDKTQYSRGGQIVVTVSITNVGSAVATNVREIGSTAATDPNQQGDPDGIAGITWSAGDESGFTKPFTIGIGETKVITRTGVLDEWAYQHGEAAIHWTFAPDVAVATAAATTNSVVLTATVAGATGDLLGTVCVGSQFEVLQCEFVSPGGPPKGVTGVKVSLLDPADSTKVLAQTTTAPDGSFAFRGVPTGQRSLAFVAPKGWHITGGRNRALSRTAKVNTGNNKLLVGARLDADPLGSIVARDDAAAVSAKKAAVGPATPAYDAFTGRRR